MLLWSLKHSPVSWFWFSLTLCILVLPCGGAHVYLSFHPTISKPATRSQLMARVPRSPSMANIASARSFSRFSSQFFFFFFFFCFFDVQIFRRTGLEDVLCARVELHLCESIEGKTQQVIVSQRFSILSLVRLYNFIGFLNSSPIVSSSITITPHP